MIKKILCGIDGSDFSAAVLAHAVGLGRGFAAEVTAVHVLGAWPPPGLAWHPDYERQREAERAAAARDLGAIVAPFAGDGVELRLQSADGHSARELARYAEEYRADLLVIGTHGRSGFDRLALGSVAEKLLRKAPCPVLTVPPGATRGPAIVYRRILSAIDFSECSTQAFNFAVDLASRNDGAVTALHVIEAFDGARELGGPVSIAALRTRQVDAELLALREMTAPSKAGGCRITEHVVLGRAHHEIVRIAGDEHMDLIVMGVRGRNAVDVTLFGSTASEVVRRASCPVVTFREGHRR